MHVSRRLEWCTNITLQLETKTARTTHCSSRRTTQIKEEKQEINDNYRRIKPRTAEQGLHCVSVSAFRKPNILSNSAKRVQERVDKQPLA